MDDTLAKMEEPGLDAVIPVSLEEPIWRIRLRLAWASFRKNWKLFAENRLGLLGLGIIILFGVMAIAQPILMRTVWADSVVAGVNVYDPVRGTDTVLVEKTVVEVVTDPLTEISQLEAQLISPGVIMPELGTTVTAVLRNPAPPVWWGVEHPHILGTDPWGSDIFSQLLKGSQVAFILGAVAAISSVVLATISGTVAAYYGGAVDTILMRVADLFILIPLLPLLIVGSALFDLGILVLAILIGLLTGLGGTAIILKSQALSVKVKPFIDAARVSGGSDWRIIANHIIPNVLPLSFLYMMFGVTAAIFTEATLSFLGLLSIDMSWGIMINTAHTQGYTLQGLRTWWLLFPAGLAVTLFSAGFFLVGRAMDEVVNPRLRSR
jgi:peptide/nickel transport system permease protein